jgi:hypothetical protein
MPNRIIKESICTSENIDQLSAFNETVFYRLIVNVDDYGRIDARPKLLAAKLFPLKDIRASQIEDALRKLTFAELVTLYEVDGKPFLQMNTWDRHQTIRAKKSKCPAPESGNKTSEIICKQLQADESKCSRNPIQSESISKSESNTISANANEQDRLFDKFWSVYPRHEGKQNARKAFEKLKVDETLLETLINAIVKQKQSAQWSDPQYVPHPATWLNGRRWEDEPVKAGPGKRVLAQQYEQREYNEAEMVKLLGADEMFN